MGYPWFKLTTMGILRGSLSQSKDVIQLVWIKLLCLMSESKLRNGRFEFAAGKPYSLDFLAISCGVSREILEGCLCEYEEDINPDTNEPRISREPDGTVVLNNWVAYQKRKDEEQSTQSVDVLVTPPSRPRQPETPKYAHMVKGEEETKEEVKRYRGEYGNVLLTDDELGTLRRELGPDVTNTRIEVLSKAIKSGKECNEDSHYGLIIAQGGK